jgi:hypothetical protein
MKVSIMPKKISSARRKPTPRELYDLDVEILFMEGLVKRDAGYIEALQILGDDYTRRGRCEEGLRIDQRLARLLPRSALVHYNLACSYSLTQQCGLAAQTLNTALSLGYHDFRWMAKDPDLKNLREHPAYKIIQARVRVLSVKQAG